jgi:hypothetical protein
MRNSRSSLNTRRRANWIAQPTPDQLDQEKLRLNVQLRLKSQRHAPQSMSREYLLDDMVLKHKGRIAQEILAQDGQIPKNVDVTVLDQPCGRTRPDTSGGC